MDNVTINKNLSVKMSLEWLRSAFYIFRESPVVFIVFCLISLLMYIIPVFGWVLDPLIKARYLSLAKEIEDGNHPKLSQLFDNFLTNINLVKLGLINLLAVLLFFTIPSIIDHYFYTNTTMQVISHQLFGLIFFVILVVVQIALWLAPAICLFNPNVSPFFAMKMSLKFGSSNLLLLLGYSLLYLVCTLISIVPFFLGLLIWVPVSNIASYFIYKTAFLNLQNNNN